MKRKLTALSKRYAAELKKHLGQGPQANFQGAHGLGRRAVTIGLETLDVAKIHNGALGNLESSPGGDKAIAQAKTFFAEAITPIEETHQAAVKARARLRVLDQALGRHKVELAASSQSLHKGITRRKAAERVLRMSEAQSKKLLRESLHLREHLQRLARRILSSQERRRKENSHYLQDEIAQTLLGIHVRLLALKAEAALNTGSLQQEIAVTRRLGDDSLARIKKFARKFAQHYET